MCQCHDSRRRTEDVRQQAEGRWDEVFARLVPQVAPAMARPGRHVDCPFHGGKDDFRVSRDFLQDGRCFCTCGSWDGFGMVMHANGWDFVKAVKAVSEVLNGSDVQVSVQRRKVERRTVENEQQRDEALRQTLRRLWKQSLPLDHPDAGLARLYFASRRLGKVNLPLSDIRFHPSLGYRNDDGVVEGHFPALLALVRTAEGKALTVHRTWLAKDGSGKAPVDAPRKTFPPPGRWVTGSAIRLDEGLSNVLHVAEGLETALAVRAIMDGTAPVWSTLSKDVLKGLDVPEQIRCICIWADRDRLGGGEKAANALLERMQQHGRQGIVMVPPGSVTNRTSVDWNDMVSNIGIEDVRRHFGVVKCLRELRRFDSLHGLMLEDPARQIVCS